MGLERLTGTPWHVDRFTREEGDKKRHRSRCLYYRGNGFCAWHAEHCWGSAHCRHYSEADTGDKDKNANDPREKAKRLAAELKASQEAKRAAADEKNLQMKMYEKEYTVGSSIEHKTYGKGLIRKSENGKITVRFEDGKEVVLSIEACVNNRIIALRKNEG